MIPPVAGLFGKLPAHGDFIRRGWPDQTVDAIDRWLTQGMTAARDRRDDEDFVEWLHAGPLWQAYVPSGRLGPLALHLALAPSIDRAGRLFPIVAGVAGDDAAVWALAMSWRGDILDPAIYDALAGRVDADALVGRIAEAIMDVAATDVPPPETAGWWPGSPTDGAPTIAGDDVDAALLERLFSVGELVRGQA